MRRVARLIFNRWVLIAIGLVTVAVLIWWVGPTISISNFYPLESEWARLALMVLPPTGWLVWKAVKARRANAALTSGLLQPTPARVEARPDASAEEVAQLRQRFEQALGLLRKIRFGTEKPSLWARVRSLGSQQYLYDLPWYVFIGAPGAGKTTALVNSGLRFPLAERLGREALRGVGGTRNCDWWFADEAVFLDTAGRYTTQQSERAVDRAAWKSFLQLLKRSRPRRPINGVLVTVSVGDLLQQSSPEGEAQAKAIRDRVQELYQELGVPFPIYVLVTKGDLLAGFSEFFAALGKQERAQVWGCSLPYGEQGLDAAALSKDLQRLERRLYEWLPERLEEERDPARRSLLYGFPQQFALLHDRLAHFVEVTFAPTKFDATPLLRGVYFTSGTQEGSPIDRAMGAVARGLGLERQLLPAQHPSGRSYFLTRLLREVVFPEAGLAGINPSWERHRQWLHCAAIGVAVAALVLCTVAWSISHSRNRDYLAEVATHVDEVRNHVAAVRAGPMSDVSPLLPALTSVRTLSETRATRDGSIPWSWRFGLYQGGKVEATSRAAYQRMLEDTLLPSLAAYLERYLRQEAPGSQEESYDALKTYVMLYDPKHFDREDVWRWYQTRGEQLLPGADADAQKALKTHFDALYGRGWVDPAVSRNDAVVVRVRAALGRDSLANRVYERFRRQPTPDVRDFTIAEKGGSQALLVFERVSGEPLTKGVPALYTKDGYYKDVVGRVELATAQLAEEEMWVLGRGGRTIAGTVSSPRLAAVVRRLYLEDYRRTWRRFLNDITVVRNRDLARTIEITRALSAPDTPLKPLMKAIARETTLSVPPEGDLASTVLGKARNVLQGPAPGSLEKTLVDDEFEDVRRFASGTGGNAPAPIDGVVQLLNEFYQMLVGIKVAQDSGQTLPPTDPANKLRAEAQRQPEPIRSALQGLVDAPAGARRDRIDAELRAQLADFCVKAISGRYPFVRSSAQDVPPEDFARLFAPGGLFETFFQKYLAQHVDTTQRPWRFKESAMGQSAALAEFQRAQVIRDVFFRGGGSTPSIQLEFKPVAMDAAIQQFVLDVDGKVVRYAHGPHVPARVQFPGPGGRSQVWVSISPPPPSGSTGIKFEGPWALFRMFDAVQIEETRQSERFVATINVEGRRSVFEIFASSVRNPFRLPELNQFRCPTAL